MRLSEATNLTMCNYEQRPLADKNDYGFKDYFTHGTKEIIGQCSGAKKEQAQIFFNNVLDRIDWLQNRLYAFDDAFKSHGLDGYGLVRVLQEISPALTGLLVDSKVEGAAKKLGEERQSEELRTALRRLGFFENAFGFDSRIDEQELALVASAASHFYKLANALKKGRPVHVLTGDEVKKAAAAAVKAAKPEPDLFITEQPTGKHPYLRRFISFDWIEWFLAQHPSNTPEKAGAVAMARLVEKLFPGGRPIDVEISIDSSQRNPEIIVEQKARL